MLSSGGYDDVVTDLASDIADGITLLKLVQVLGNHTSSQNVEPHPSLSLSLCTSS